MVDYKGHINENSGTLIKSDHRICAVINISALDIASDPTVFKSSVSSLVSGEMNISGVKSITIKGRVSANEISERLKIPLYMYHKTIQATTKLPDIMVKEPFLTKKIRHQMLRYSGLACYTFMEAFFSFKKSGSSERGYI